MSSQKFVKQKFNKRRLSFDYDELGCISCGRHVKVSEDKLCVLCEAQLAREASAFKVLAHANKCLKAANKALSRHPITKGKLSWASGIINHVIFDIDSFLIEYNPGAKKNKVVKLKISP